ncbi:helix-turn-helix domain-containing protein [Nocardia brasiliensis]|uniref:helix-turn-helix domain-containing protein n=1 Tax=Nocardia brasiliensis TaxID=37326 RepID=UPI0024565609|nr:helix-turn-helix domain-containing protein [Nocardia brasiliensis]
MSLVPLYTAEEVAAAFRLESTNWVEEAARQKLIPHTRVGRNLRFTVAQFDQAIKILEVRAATAMHPTQVTVRPHGVTPELDTGKHQMSALVRTRLNQTKP